VLAIVRASLHDRMRLVAAARHIRSGATGLRPSRSTKVRCERLGCLDNWIAPL